MLKSKIHNAKVIDKNIHYEGSITIDSTLMKKADILPYEKVEVYNITNGNRFDTYAIEGEPDSGVICVNGAAAHLVKVGDLLIIAAYATVDEKDTKQQKPKILILDDRNKICKIKTETAKSL
jgi:aspartate 1-decarboxylase